MGKVFPPLASYVALIEKQREGKNIFPEVTALCRPPLNRLWAAIDWLYAPEELGYKDLGPGGNAEEIADPMHRNAYIIHDGLMHQCLMPIVQLLEQLDKRKAAPETNEEWAFHTQHTCQRASEWIANCMGRVDNPECFKALREAKEGLDRAAAVGQRELDRFAGASVAQAL